MTNNEYECLVAKCVAVMARCETSGQLRIALKYRCLVTRKLGLNINLLRGVQFAHKTGMAYGLALRKIQYKQDLSNAKL